MGVLGYPGYIVRLRLKKRRESRGRKEEEG